ncbi:Y-family DNA polymerase [Pedobacter sp. MC2016-14]|uniref:Y-family DNA polymerase n=1 Tax=Pedobacter sp. MC2016-14 TaxID=2897327 RepID=UPI001E638830|nr:Y-family DNA polymerase [Pedobacter sp. MC2016-14]MCD0489678.1 Y-family DNA polymerase [Pedobacter sp. MC2016-14]
MIALIDSNNFYVSAERAFQPQLRGKAGCVLSNNDGCAISRSNEAKKELGIKMGTPYFEMREKQQQGLLWWRSSNYTLYQDMMRRITSIVRKTFPDQEIYSIDECFCDLTGHKYSDIESEAIRLRAKILKFTDVPVCIGIGATRTLAKIANKLAKKISLKTGVFLMNTPEKIEEGLKSTEIDEVWGIGPKYAIKLIQDGVYTAWDFIQLPEDYVLKLMTIQGRRTYRELKGERCIPMEYDRPDKEGITTARSFGGFETELPPMEEALSTYVANAALKLRKQNSVTAKIFVFAHTSKFAVISDRYSAGLEVKLLVATNDTGQLIKEATAALRKIFVKGYRYQKVGIELRELKPYSQVQASIFQPVDTELEKKKQKALKIIDNLNASFGKDTVRYAAMGFEKKWSMRQEFLSRKFTTRIEDIIIVHAK